MIDQPTTKYASFKTDRDDAQLLRAIAKRAVTHATRMGIPYPLPTAEMDLTACHVNGCPLDLPRLMNAKDGDFGHDIFGIRRHIDRITGRLGGEFQPRCVKRVES